MDRLTSMEAFVKAVDLGSFSAAGAALDLSGPMVGKHIRFLEERLGARLINRTTRRQSLTDFGKAYYDRCRVILSETQAAEALAADQLSEPRGKLRVTVPVHFGRRCVAPILLDLVQRHPALELELSLTDRLTDLTEGDHDLAIRTGDPRDSATIVGRRLARQHMIVCASPSYLENNGRPGKIGDLSQHQSIVYGRSGRAAPWRFPQKDDVAIEVEPRGRLRFDDLEAIAEAAAGGAGLAWLPSWLVRLKIETGALIDVLPNEPRFLYDVHALWLRTPHLPLRVRLAIDALAAALPKLM